MSNELLFFAALSLAVAGVAVTTVYRPKKPSEVIGFASLALGLVVLLDIAIVEGRLVYNTGTGQLAADGLLLVTSLVYGGLHTFLLLAGFSFIAFGMSLRSRKGSVVPAILIVAGFLQVVGAYSWLTPRWFNVFAAVALWLGILYASRLPVKETVLRGKSS